MPIWRLTPVTEMPNSTLAAWRVLETDTGARHLCGYASREREGRVTSAVVTFDPARSSATTSSGRVYRLVGRPGHDADAEYVLQRWLAVNAPRTITDVTDEAWASIQAASQTARIQPEASIHAGRAETS